MRSDIAILITGLVAPGGCSAAPQHASRSLDDLGRELARTICLGPPKAVQRVKNPHMPRQLDRLETRECAAGSSTLYVASEAAEPKVLAVAVEVRAKSAGLPPHLQIGEPIADALRALGEPQSRSPESAVYSLAFDSTDTVTLRATDGRISSLQWAWVLD